jgi:hypothetical protein
MCLCTAIPGALIAQTHGEEHLVFGWALCVSDGILLPGKYLVSVHKHRFTAETHDCMDAGVRATHGAVAGRTQRNSLMKTIKRFAFFATGLFL